MEENEPFFELVREETPFHDACNHYHWPGYDCPTRENPCRSTLCCVFAGELAERE